jgi:hypothetical protein
VVAPDEVFQPTLTWGTATRSHIFWVGIFENMEEETRARVPRLVFPIEKGSFICKIGKFGRERGCAEMSM